MRSHGLFSLLGMVCAEGPTHHNSPNYAWLESPWTPWACEERGGKTCAPTGLVSALGMVCAEGPTHHNSPNCAQLESPSTLWACEERGGKHALPRA